MENRKRQSKMYLALALVVLLAVTAFTACSPNKDKVQVDVVAPTVAPAAATVIPPLAILVKEGKLTQSQAEAVDAAIKAAEAQGKLPHLALGPLEEAGTITEEEEQAILAELKANPPPGAPPVAPIVAPEVASAAKAPTVAPASKAPASKAPAVAPIVKAPEVAPAAKAPEVVAPAVAPAPPPAVIEAPPAVAEAPPPAVPEAPPTVALPPPPPGDVIPPVAAVLKAGTITQAKAEEISAAVKAGKDQGKKPPDVLKDLEEAGTITEAQEQALLSSFIANPPPGVPPAQ